MSVQKNDRLLISRIVLHLVATGHLGYAVYYDYSFAKLPSLGQELRVVTPFAGKFKYLTFLTGLLQCIYYLLAIVCDLYAQQQVQRLRIQLLASFVWPLSCTISVTFWVLCAVNERLIFPGVLEFVYPSWLIHSMHTLTVVYALLEICLTPHRYPPRTDGFIGVGAILGCYLIWVQFVHFWTGIWSYPFLAAFNLPMRWCFYALIIGLSLVYYLIGERLSHALWASYQEGSGRRKSKEANV